MYLNYNNFKLIIEKKSYHGMEKCREIGGDLAKHSNHVILKFPDLIQTLAG